MPCSGAALFLTVLGLLGVALGALVRNTAGGIATLVGCCSSCPVIAAILPDSWGDTINPYLPINAGEAITAMHLATRTRSPPWDGLRGVLRATRPSRSPWPAVPARATRRLIATWMGAVARARTASAGDDHGAEP